MLEKTEGTIKIGQPGESGKIGHTRRGQTKQQQTTTTQYVLDTTQAETCIDKTNKACMTT